MKLLNRSSYLGRVLILFGFYLLLTQCSGGGNSDNPAPEGNTTSPSTPPSITPPSAPSALSLSGSATLTTSPTLTWTASVAGSASIASYSISIGTSAGGTDILANTDIGNILSYQATGLSLSLATNYFFSLYSIDTDGNQSSSVSSSAWSTGLIITNGAYELPGGLTTLTSCSDYLTSPYYEGQGDGDYWIDPDGAGTLAAFKVSCDQTTDGGGWQLVLNYIHQGGTDPASQLMTTKTPLLGSAAFGDDGSLDSTSWGHASNSLLNQVAINDMRFYCATSLHSRVIDFKTSHTNSINYAQTGLGRMLGLASSFTPLAGHSANLPGAATSFGQNYGDDALVRFSFSVSGTWHWSVGFGSRWECDDFAFNSANDTIHQVWVR